MMENPIGVNEPALKYKLAHEGITKSDFLAFVSDSGMNLTEFSALLPVSKRTIEKVKDHELLSPQVSDRVMSLVSLYQFGELILDSNDNFKLWLHTPLIALANKRPIEFLNNETGISMIKDILGRVEHGVYS